MYFSVVIYNANYNNVENGVINDVINDVTNGALNENEKIVYGAMKANPQITIANKHIRNIISENELEESSTISKMEIV